MHALMSATATHCNTHALPNTATRCQKKKAVPDTNEALFEEWNCNALQHAAAHCNALVLQRARTATRSQCNALQRTPKQKQTVPDKWLPRRISKSAHCITLVVQHTATHCTIKGAKIKTSCHANSLQHTATNTATHCNKHALPRAKFA